MVGKHTRLITCLAHWNSQDATEVVPQALAAGIGLYGFSFPRSGNGTIPLEKFMRKPVAELKGDERNIAVLDRAYDGVSLDAVCNDKDGFTEAAKQAGARGNFFKIRNNCLQVSVLHAQDQANS